MIREDLVASAVTFLHDPSVSVSPVAQRVAFLKSKNLSPEEVDAALARAGEDPSNASPQQYPASPYPSQQQLMRPSPPNGPTNAYQGSPASGYWQPARPPPPQRDWRDFFIMATILSGVSYGLFAVAKRYVSPLIAPPTPPQLEQDKASIDASFARAFALLDQLTADTAALKASEATRTERLDTALAEVEGVIGELKTAGRRREDDARRIGDEVRGLRDLVPKAMEAHKQTTDDRLKEVNTELKGLKTLVGNRLGQGAGERSYTPSAPGANGSSAAGKVLGGASETSGQATTERATASPAPTARTGPGSARAAIPAWQMAAVAAAKKTDAVGPENATA